MPTEGYRLQASNHLGPLLVAATIPYGCLLAWLLGSDFGATAILAGLIGMMGLCFMAILAGYALASAARWFFPSLRKVERLWLKTAFVFVGVFYVFFAMKLAF